MSDIYFPATDRRSEFVTSSGSHKPGQRVLVTRPESFFSLKFHMQVEAEDFREEPRSKPAMPQTRQSSIIDRGLLMAICFVGIPFLTACVMATMM